MKIINGLNSAELLALNAGEEVGIAARRSQSFQSFNADQVILIGQMPAHLTMSIQRSEPGSVMTVGRVLAVSAIGPNVELAQVTATNDVVEDAQIRIAPHTAIDLALALLAAVAPTLADNVSARIALNPAIAALFKSNA